MGFLSDLVDRIRADLDRDRPDDSALASRAMALPPARGFSAALRDAEAPAVIAEVKRASPSAGAIAEVDPGAQAAAYEAGGAAAVSVLTEPRHFDGSIADLAAVRLATALPLLRKDFVVHPAQVIEARARGADAVLLIAGAVSEPELRALALAATDVGIDVLVEAFSERDLEAALATGADLIGVNARDLQTLDVDVSRALRILRRVPSDRIAVLESGISTRTDVRRAVEAGARAILVGEALMRAADPAAKLRELRGVG